MVNNTSNDRLVYNSSLPQDALSRLSTRRSAFGHPDLVCASNALRFRLILLFRALANSLMSSGGGKVEWAYAFDLHCNGFFALYSWLYILQLFLLPIVTGPRFPSLLVGNLLYLLALSGNPLS